MVLEAIHALDRKLQRPLAIVIPDYSQLRADPARYLANNQVTLGPRKRQILALVIGLACGIGVVAFMIFLFRQMPRPKQPDPSRAIGMLVSFVLTTIVVRAIALRFMPGGHLTLTAKGAELLHQDVALFLPWDVFQATGSVFSPDHKLVVMPINPRVPVAVTTPDGDVTAIMPEDMEVPQAELSDFNQLALKDLYEARITELGELLRDLGLRLGSADNGTDEQLQAMIAPLAVVDEGGWLRIQMTQLPFPPICAGCGESTTETLDLTLS